MATTKTTRMDAQGRVILPPHIRKEMKLSPGQLLTVALEGDTITVRPAEERCTFCGGAIHDKYITGPCGMKICKSCATALATILEN